MYYIVFILQYRHKVMFWDIAQRGRENIEKSMQNKGSNDI